MKDSQTVVLHGNEWKLSDVEENANYWSKEHLRKNKYEARDALVDKTSGSRRPYSGKNVDEKISQ